MVKPKISPYIVGIDLGTSNSTAAIYIKGQALVIPIDGKPELPSVVHVRDSGEILVGTAAKNQLLISPDNTVASVKREIGNSAFQKEFAGQPGKSYSATDISAEILAKIRTGVEQDETVDLRGSLKYAVLCIPANFTDVQKQNTLEAARLANFEVIRLLEEPVAAAIAYALETKLDQRIMVYDLGGGTFDVAILNVDSTESEESKFSVVAKEGIPVFGGDDFDRALMDAVANDFREKTDIDLFDLQKDQGINRKALRQAQQKLKEAAESAKIELGQADSTDILVPNLLKDETGNVHNIEFEVTREAFEVSIRGMLEQTRATMQTALDSADLTIDDISRIVLVGGSTRVPLVREIVTEMFDKEPYCNMDPATAVARGAAILGATLGAPEPKSDEEQDEVGEEDRPDAQIEITDIVTHYLGIQIAGGQFSNVLQKGVEIPVEPGVVMSKGSYETSRDDMTEIRISVYQAPDQPRFVTDEGCVCIGEFFLTGIPPKPRGEIKIDVEFEINLQNLLTVRAKPVDESAFEGKTIEINRS